LNFKLKYLNKKKINVLDSLCNFVERKTGIGIDAFVRQAIYDETLYLPVTVNGYKKLYPCVNTSWVPRGA